MYVLVDKQTNLYLKKRWDWKTKSILTPKLQKARIFGRKSDYKQSTAWTGGTEWLGAGKGYKPKFDDNTRPYTAVEVRLFKLEE